MSCKEKVKSMNSDKLQVPSMVTPDSCAFGEASTEAGQTISKATSHVLAGPALPQPQLQGAWTKPLLITGATERSTMLSDNPVTENSEWPALSTRDIEGEEQYQLELDESSGPIDLLTLSGKRLLRKKPVKPSAKGMEWQLQSTSHGRGNRGGENRGKVR
ncbi:BnaC04g15720D [Brassica napus]|uniref:BnaC04g15720D protein n=1 Tax=Brassica napus TaxID=3708 RepID=A0A078FSD3_BRANA|nr:BnaC04g15720D [Brassica napus]